MWAAAIPAIAQIAGSMMQKNNASGNGTNNAWKFGVLPGYMGGNTKGSDWWKYFAIPGFGFFGGDGNNFQNPSDAANPYLEKIPSAVGQYYNPYINAGQQMLGKLEGQYGDLTAPQSQIQGEYGQLAGNLPMVQGQLNQMMQNPGGFINTLGQGYQQSPGYKFQVDQATGAANRAAAAGGMLGSPAEQQSLATTVNGLANQDYNTWLNHALGVYGQGLQGGMGLGQFGLQGQTNLFGEGLQGEQGINAMGFGASDMMAKAIQDMLTSQAYNAYAGAENQNENQGGSTGGILSGIGNLAGGLFGGKK